MNTSPQGIEEIKSTEAFREFAYPDPHSPLGEKYRKVRWGFQPARNLLAQLPADDQGLSGAPWTIGYGFTKGVKVDDRMSRAEADARFPRELVSYENAVTRGCTLQPTQGQFDAMVSLCYNIGTGAFLKSTVLRRHNAGDFPAAARAFGLFNMSGGKVSNGLTLRRQAEGNKYLNASVVEAKPDALEPTPPQNVDPERPMTSSTINRASVAAGTTATVAGVSEVVKTISDTKTSIESLGTWLVPVLCVAVVALCGYIIYERYKQRKNGWV